jgi:hypothetical protein
MEEEAAAPSAALSLCARAETLTTVERARMMNAERKRELTLTMKGTPATMYLSANILGLPLRESKAKSE